MVAVHKLNFKSKSIVFKSGCSLHEVLQQIKVYIFDESLIQKSASASTEVGSIGHESIYILK